MAPGAPGAGGLASAGAADAASPRATSADTDASRPPAWRRDAPNISYLPMTEPPSPLAAMAAVTTVRYPAQARLTHSDTLAGQLLRPRSNTRLPAVRGRSSRAPLSAPRVSRRPGAGRLRKGSGPGDIARVNRICTDVLNSN